MLSNGNIVVVNVDQQFNSALASVKFTIHSPVGGIINATQRVWSNPLSSYQYDPQVSALAGGGFVVVFEDDQGPTSDYRFAIFNNDGDSVVDPTLTVDDMQASYVAGLPDGGFVIASPTQFQRYTAAGDPVGAIGSTAEGYGDLVPTSDGRLFRDSFDSDWIFLDPRDAGTVWTGTAGAEQATSPVGGGELDGRGGSDRLYGHDGNDIINGGAGADFVDAGGGDDTVRNLDGANGDTLRGGAGTDTLDVAGSNYANGIILIDLHAGIMTNTLTSATDVVNSFANLLGSSRGETARESAALNNINLGGGNDRLLVRFSTLEGDVYNGGAGVDTFDLTVFTGNTITFRVDLAAQAWGHGGQSESLIGFENVDGSDGVGGDIIVGSVAANVLNGRGGNDIIRGGASADVVSGAAGNDSFEFATTDFVLGESVDGGADTDAVVLTGAGVHRFDLISISSIEVISFFDFGTAGRTAQFNAAQFSAAGISLTAVIDGNGQNGVQDSLDVSMAGESKFDASGFAFHQWSGGDFLRVSGDGDAEIITGSSLDDQLFGGGSSDELAGGEGRDILDGGDGDDVLRGDGDNDTMHGGTGNDTFYTDGLDTITDSGGAQDLVVASASFSLAGTTIENLTLAASAVDGSATGNDLVNILRGNSGHNSLDGGGLGDTMIGHGGNDTYAVDNATDVVTETAGGGYDTVNTELNAHMLAANVERVNFVGSGDFVGTGNNLANRFQGGSGDDRFVDVLGGADIFSGNAGTDTVDFRTSATGAVIDMATLVHGGAAAGDSYSGIEKFLGSNTAGDTMTGGGTGRWVFVGGGGGDTLTGGIKNDQLIGQGGNDTLSGGADRDSLDGGTGNDTMTGGTQGDVFVFIDAAFGQDTITDYQDGIDSFKILSGVATSLADFTVTNNGPTSVTLTLNAAPVNFVTINGAAPITIAADDFVFY